MSEKGNCTNATGDDGVKMEKDKEARKESEKTGLEYDKETIEGRGKEEKNADDGQVPNEENRRKSSDFWLLWPAPSTRAMARFSFKKCSHYHSFFHQLRSVGSLSRPSSPPGRASMWRSTHPDILKTSTNSILKTSGTTITQTKDGDSASLDPSLDLLRCFGPTPSPSNNSIYLPQGQGWFLTL